MHKNKNERKIIEEDERIKKKKGGDKERRFKK